MKDFILSILFLVSPSILSAQNFDSTESKIVAVDKEFSDSSVAEGPYRSFVKFLTEDAYILPTLRPPERGREAIRKFYGDFPSGARLVWTPAVAKCSADGSIGFTIGDYTYAPPDSSGKSRTGKYLTVWKRQSDGSLRAIADMGSPAAASVDTTGKWIYERSPLIHESTADFMIEVGTYELRAVKDSDRFPIRRGNYVTAWRVNKSGVKSLVADYQN